MLIALNLVEKIKNTLEYDLSTNRISDFKVFLKPNLEIGVFVVSPNTEYFNETLSHVSINVEIISEEQKMYDPYYNQLFINNGNNVDLGFKRRFASFSSINPKLLNKVKTPVVTFYSYKGGMGRTTTLAAYAMYCSIHESKKVVILDCDFEAPGYLNLFGLNNYPDILNGNVNGIVEYLLDSDYDNLELDMISSYMVQVESKYSGNGSITIMPAGNLNDDRNITSIVDSQNNEIRTHKDHFIEALSRLDTSRGDSIVDSFNRLLLKIEEQLKPDIVLIDSRTGFNDIFGITALNLSQCVVAFFGSSEQTKPGLRFLLDKYNQIKRSNNRETFNMILVNSILPEDNIKEHNSTFRSIVEKHMIEQQEVDQSDFILPDMYFISRNKTFENIGVNTYNDQGDLDLTHLATIEENLISYITNLNKNRNQEHLNLFKGITYRVSPELNKELINTSFQKLKHIVLSNLVSLLGKDGGKVRLFAEYEPISPELFFYRDCMNEIISQQSKFIISGFKGTGKTYLYKAFKNEKIKNELIRRAKQEDKKFIFIDIISISKVEGENYKKFAFESINLTELKDKAHFFKRLWTVYFWNSIMLESENMIGYISKFLEEVKPITVFEETNQRFNKIIQSTELFLKVEEDLRSLDNHLTINDLNLIILFDQLDKDIHPNQWREIVSPLVKYWERNPFNRIIPKIFVRTDLFGRLELNNSLNLKKNNMISIEWEREELYSYFLKLILSRSRNEFFAIVDMQSSFDDELKNEIKHKSSEHNQVPLTRYLLEPLISIVFGREIISPFRKQFLANSYEYFFSNFKNANNTISIRPFINLISYSSSEAFNQNRIHKYRDTLPIINPDFYLRGEFRELAVDEHFSDLTNEGNYELKFIVQFIRENSEFKQQFLTSNELQALLNGVIEQYGNEFPSMKYEELKILLEANGIIEESIKPDGRIYYFAMLYKFWLGLKNRKYQYGKAQKMGLYSGSDFEKIEAHFKNRLKIDGIYQQSLLGTMIFEATGGPGKGRKWSEIFEYQSYDHFLLSLQKLKIIEIKDQSKFKYLKHFNIKTLNEL